MKSFFGSDMMGLKTGRKRDRPRVYLRPATLAMKRELPDIGGQKAEHRYDPPR